MLVCLLQLGVHRGRAAPSGAGQAGEDGLLRAVHDRGGADAGVVPAQAVRRGNHPSVLTHRPPFFVFSPLCPEKI